MADSRPPGSPPPSPSGGGGSAPGTNGQTVNRPDSAKEAAAGAAGAAAGGAKGAATGAAKGAASGAAKEGTKQAAKEGAKGAAKGAQKGAQAGAKAGSAVLPVVGTAIGGAAGGLAGGAAGGAAGTAKGAAQGSAKGAAEGAGRGASEGGRKGAASGANKAMSKVGGGGDGIPGMGGDLPGESAMSDDETPQPPADAAASAAKGAAGGAMKGALKGAATGGVAGAAMGALKGGAKGGKKGAKGGGGGGGGKKGGKGKGGCAAMLLPVAACGMALILFIAVLGGGDMGATDNQASIYAATRNEVPPTATSTYMEAGTTTDTPWQIIAAVADHQTKHGLSAPDGVTRAYPQSDDADELVGESGWGGEDDGSASTTDAPASTTTTAPDPDAGVLWPVVDPPIIDDTPLSVAAPPAPATTTTTAASSSTTVAEGATTTTTAASTTTAPTTTTTAAPVAVEGGPWLGVFLIDKDAWTEYQDGDTKLDAQRTSQAAVFIGSKLHTAYSDNPGNTEDFSVEGSREMWVDAILALPVKGLDGDEAQRQTAGAIYDTALAWINGKDKCDAGGSGAPGSYGLPTAGPIKIGDPLNFKLYGALTFTEKAWSYSIPIAQEARRRGLSDRAIVLALGTSIVETGGIQMYASSVVPESLNYPHDLVGHDHDSVGLFQQRPSMGWGTVAELMDPAKSAGAFYDALVTKTNWETRDLGEVAQSVQGSAHPERYGPAMLDGAAILATIDQSGQGGAPAGGTATATTTTAAGATTTTVAGGATTTIPPPAASTATPSKVFLVGDSLTAGAEASHQLPSTWTIDAKVGRTTAEGIEILKTTDVASYDAVIVALGANDYGATEAAYKDQIATVMTHVGATKPIWWVNVDVGSPKLAAAADGPNKALAAAVYPNLKVGDWSTEASTKITAAMRASDGIHYNAEGYKVYAAYLSALPAGAAGAVPEACAGADGTSGTVIDIDTGAPIELCDWGTGATGKINCQILDEVVAMAAAAQADGVTITGGAYRDPAQQIQLRKEHCGTSHYAIYEMSSSSCSPPTAKPGHSQHEKGLAIDMENCSNHSTACYVWLNEHAASFGFYNLPSEAWHWSTTGS